jgi:hypothetical protein
MFGIVIASVLFGSSSPAQRDAPVWESYLTKISAFHHRDYATQFRFRWKKSGGPEESVEHQCYLVAYVKRDEEEILKIASDPKLLDREDRRSQGELFFDVLLNL